MALIIKDRVQETSTTSGTGTLTLAGAVTGYQSFGSAIGNGNTTYYGVYETLTNNWEIGIGTVSVVSGVDYLARTTVLASSNAGSLVSFGGNQLAVWGDMPAAKGMYLDASGYATGYSLSNASFISPTNFVPTSAPSYAEGNVWFDSTFNGLAYQTDVNGVTIYPGQEVAIEVYNNSGSTIAQGSVVYLTGQHSSFPTIALAQANSLSTSNAVGLVQTAIANNSNGWINILGEISGLDTHSFTAGDTLYLSATTPGAIVNVQPTSPNYAVRIGFCTYSNPSNGIIFTSVRNTYVGTNNIVGQVPPANGGTGVNNGTNTLTWNASYSLNQSVASGAAPTFTGTNFSSIPNGALTNSSITINGTPVSLGGSTTVSVAAGGSNTQVQYNNSGAFAGSANMTFDGTSLTAGNLISTNGLYGKATFTGSYTDGIVVDYSSGNGRISVGTSDTLTFYNGGLATTTLGSFSTTGLLQAVGGFQAPSTGPFFLNATTVSANYTVPSNYNAHAAGKITINTGVTVTVSTGSRLVIV